jgi:predicted NAD/FAD-dependent oxidoreductase
MAYTVDPLVGSFEIWQVRTFAQSPRLSEPLLVPTHNWYCVAPVPAVQAKVTVAPERTLPATGDVMAGAVVVAASAGRAMMSHAKIVFIISS